MGESQAQTTDPERWLATVGLSLLACRRWLAAVGLSLLGRFGTTCGCATNLASKQLAAAAARLATATKKADRLGFLGLSAYKKGQNRTADEDRSIPYA